MMTAIYSKTIILTVFCFSSSHVPGLGICIAQILYIRRQSKFRVMDRSGWTNVHQWKPQPGDHQNTFY